MMVWFLLSGFIKGYCLNIRAVLYLMFFAASTYVFSGFPAGTQVKVPGGYVSIEQLKVGDFVFAVKPDGNCVITSVEQVASYTWHKYMLIEVDKGFIVAVTGQLFYQPIENSWIKAKHIKSGTALLSGMNNVVCVHSATKVYESIEIFDIRLKDVHTFCVSERDIVVHNFLQFTIGFSIAWGFGVVTFEAVWQACIIGLVALGLRSCSGNKNNAWSSQAFVGTPLGGQACEIGQNKSWAENVHGQEYVAVASGSICPENNVKDRPVGVCNHSVVQVCANLSNDSMHETMLARSGVQGARNQKTEPRHNYPISQHSPGKDCGMVECDPPPKGPHGYFIPAPYHQEYPTPGCKSTGPSWHDGQKALDVSVEVENKSDGGKKHRVAVYGGKYIVFDQTSPGVYHAHHRAWNKQDGMNGLTPQMQNALKKAGIVKSNGRIIKDAKINNIK